MARALVGACIEGAIKARRAKITHTHALPTHTLGIAGCGLRQLALREDVTRTRVYVAHLAHPAIATVAFSADTHAMAITVLRTRVDVTGRTGPALIARAPPE